MEVLDILNQEFNGVHSDFNSAMKKDHSRNRNIERSTFFIHEDLQIALECQRLVTYAISLLVNIKDVLKSDMILPNNVHKKSKYETRIREVNELLSYYKDYSFTFSGRSKVLMDELKFVSYNEVEEVDNSMKRRKNG